jgi:AraC-like DNA-binding protein
MFVLVIYYLENLEFGKPIDLPALAHFAGTHPRRFVETFRAHYGLTPHAWRERYRLRQAVHQLQETALPIKEIAAEFHLSPTYFTTWIKKWTGYSALDLRHQQPLWGEGTR